MTFSSKWIVITKALNHIPPRKRKLQWSSKICFPVLSTEIVLSSARHTMSAPSPSTNYALLSFLPSILRTDLKTLMQILKFFNQLSSGSEIYRGYSWIESISEIFHNLKTLILSVYYYLLIIITIMWLRITFFSKKKRSFSHNLVFFFPDDFSFSSVITAIV